MSSSSGTGYPVSAPGQTKTPAQCKATGKSLWKKIQDAQTAAKTQSAMALAKARDESDLAIFRQRFYWNCKTQETRKTANGQAYSVDMMNAQPKSTSPGPAVAFHNGISSNGRVLHAFSNDKQGTAQPRWSLLVNVLLGLYGGGVNRELAAMDFSNPGRVREVVREQISNRTWLDAAETVATEKGAVDKNVWFALRPTDDDDDDDDAAGFFTMLGTPNGAGVAWLLIDYAVKFAGVGIDHIIVNHRAKEMRVVLK